MNALAPLPAARPVFETDRYRVDALPDGTLLAVEAATGARRHWRIPAMVDAAVRVFRHCRDDEREGVRRFHRFLRDAFQPPARLAPDDDD